MLQLKQSVSAGVESSAHLPVSSVEVGARTNSPPLSLSVPVLGTSQSTIRNLHLSAESTYRDKSKCSACKSSLTRDKTHLPIAAHTTQQTANWLWASIINLRLRPGLCHMHLTVCLWRLTAFLFYVLRTHPVQVEYSLWTTSPLHPLSLPTFPPPLTNHHPTPPLHRSFCSACRTTTLSPSVLHQPGAVRVKRAGNLGNLGNRASSVAHDLYDSILCFVACV